MLLDQSLVYNTHNSITGVLAFADRQFAQVLEGPEAVVDALFERICVDKRHGNVQLDLREPCPQRLFPLWSMAFVGFEANLQPMFDNLNRHRGPEPEMVCIMHDIANLLEPPARTQQCA